MSSKIITTVLAAAIVGPFAFFAVQDAVSIKQHLQEQSVHIEKLNTEYKQLDKELNKTVEVKEQTVTEVQKLEQEANDTAAERAKLEAELGAN